MEVKGDFLVVVGGRAVEVGVPGSACGGGLDCGGGEDAVVEGFEVGWDGDLDEA